MNVERVKTGVEGLDALIQGGFPKGYTILVSGAPGTGKTILSMQFLCTGAMKGEKGIYVVFDQHVEDLVVQSGIFGFDIQKLIDSGNLKIVHMDTIEVSIDKILGEIRKFNSQRVVIDSLSAVLLHPVAWKDMDIPYAFSGSLEEMIPDPKNMIIATRILMNSILRGVKELGCTSVIISELTEGSKSLSRDSISEFLVDGIITMHYTISGSVPGRNLMIRKMRATKHSEMIHPIEFIEGTGVRVLMP